MKIRQLEGLRALMDTGNMTRAAELIGVAQPSLSVMISNLEHELGFKLFTRVKGGLIATPEAKHLLPDIIRTLESVEFTRQNAKQIKEQTIGDLRIAAYPDIAIDFLPQIISRFLENRQGVQINLHARRSEMMSGLLPTQQFDMAIATQFPNDNGLDCSEYMMRCVVAMPEGHALAGCEMITLDDLLTERFVTLLPEHNIVIQLNELITRKKHSDWKADIETQTFESVASFIRNGAGIGLIDPITAQRYEGNGLVVKTFSEEVFHKLYVLTPRDRPRSQVAVAFHEVLNNTLSNYAEPEQS